MVFTKEVSAKRVMRILVVVVVVVVTVVWWKQQYIAAVEANAMYMSYYSGRGRTFMLSCGYAYMCT